MTEDVDYPFTQFTIRYCHGIVTYPKLLLAMALMAMAMAIVDARFGKSMSVYYALMLGWVSCYS